VKTVRRLFIALIVAVALILLLVSIAITLGWLPLAG
jgi:hypothetical protein